MRVARSSWPSCRSGRERGGVPLRGLTGGEVSLDPPATIDRLYENCTGGSGILGGFAWQQSGAKRQDGPIPSIDDVFDATVPRLEVNGSFRLSSNRGSSGHD